MPQRLFGTRRVLPGDCQSIGRLDVPPVMVITMLVACAVVLLSAVVDILYALLDPRVRLS